MDIKGEEPVEVEEEEEEDIFIEHSEKEAKIKKEKKEENIFKNLNFDELNEFLLEYIKENKSKSINYFLDFKKNDDDLLTYEYQLQQQNDLIKNLIKLKKEKYLFFLDLKDLNKYLRQYYEANKLDFLSNLPNNNGKTPADFTQSLNTDEISHLVHENNSSDISSENEVISNIEIKDEKDEKLIFDEEELIGKFQFISDNHPRLYPHYKNISLLCVNIITASFKRKYSFLDFSAGRKREKIKQIIISLKDFLEKSLGNNYANHKNYANNNNNLASEFFKYNNNNKKSKSEYNQDNLWEIYENNDINNDSAASDYYEEKDNNHIFSAKRQRKFADNNSIQKNLKYSERLLGYFLYNTCIEELSNFLM